MWEPNKGELRVWLWIGVFMGKIFTTSGNWLTLEGAIPPGSEILQMPSIRIQKIKDMFNTRGKLWRVHLSDSKCSTYIHTHRCVFIHVPVCLCWINWFHNVTWNFRISHDSIYISRKWGLHTDHAINSMGPPSPIFQWLGLASRILSGEHKPCFTVSSLHF